MRIGILFNDKSKMIMKYEAYQDTAASLSDEVIYIFTDSEDKEIIEELDMNKPAKSGDISKKYKLFNQFRSYLLKK